MSTCWCGDDHEPHCPTCDKCGAGISTAFMAVYCPERENCGFWPDDRESQEFLRALWNESTAHTSCAEPGDTP